jgi:polysaccharide deacetylase family protein (PEP-CTERM system associated)
VTLLSTPLPPGAGRPRHPAEATGKRHILTVSVEDYFHVAALRGAILRKHWDRLEPHLEQNLDDVLEMLDRHRARATFFVLGLVAEMYPELVARVAAHGHEIAQSGYFPRSMQGTTPGEFRKELRRTRAIVEEAAGTRMQGYRSPTWMRMSDLWMLDVLAEEGYLYDSSINPILRRFAGDPVKTRIHQHRHSARDLSIWELPITTAKLLGFRVAITGGNYLRQLPHTLLAPLVARRADRDEEPLVFYFMPWEIDRQQPDIQGISRVQRVRHYRNLGKTRWVMNHYLATLPFGSIAEHLGLVRQPAEPSRPSRPIELDTSATLQPDAPAGPPVTLVVPMYNEEQNVRYLHRTLVACRKRFAPRFHLHLVLVDDCSSDGTWEMLEEVFGGLPDCRLVRHQKNQGVAAAILTGIRAAPTEVVASIDCDCSYDPHVFEEMIPLIANADLVTASPYHPSGSVLNVPGWRLFLSKSLSKMYSAALHERFYTYTSCCRVYRKSAVADLQIENGGFLGVAEMLIRLQQAGRRIVEHPATLESRLLGHSKMRVARTIGAHLGLLRRITLGEGEPK